MFRKIQKVNRPETERSMKPETKEELQESIATRIRVIRRVKQMSQREFAAKVGVSQALISSFEQGRSIPNDVVIENISHLTGCSCHWLKTGERECDLIQDGEKQEAMKKHIQELLDKMSPESLYFMSKQADLVYCMQMEKESVNLLDD